jgi:hypothetical protein
VWIPVAVIGSVFSVSLLIVVTAGGISLIAHLPLIHRTGRAGAKPTEPEDALEILFGRTER